LLALALLAYAAYRYRVRQLVAVANVRAHIAADLHDDIGANLTRIAILSDTAEKGETLYLPEDIGDKHGKEALNQFGETVVQFG
jgi:signal transduction histidine kinase